jgi:hypothetical protein
MDLYNNMMTGGDIMEKLHFTKSEVTSFLEEMQEIGMATEDEQLLYENYIWDGELVKNNTYKRVLKKMKKFLNEEF